MERGAGATQNFITFTPTPHMLLEHHHHHHTHHNSSFIHHNNNHELTGIPINRVSINLPHPTQVSLSLTSQGFPLPPQPSSSSSYNYVTNSIYLLPAMDLLHQTCNLDDHDHDVPPNILNLHKSHKSLQKHQFDHPSSLHSLDLLQLHIRKTKLIHLLQELDRRYDHYRNQMKAVTQPFEAVAGNSAAKVYSSMSSRAISRHFRCLKDSIFTQIKLTKNAIEKKSDVTANTNGETPRLRLLDQKFRHQKSLQQMSSMDAHPWRPQRGLPERSVSVLRAWLFEHFLHPYPSDVDKHILSRQTGLSRSQVSNWFINARVRLWKPMVEEMYTAEVTEADEDHNHSNYEGTLALDPTVTTNLPSKTPKLVTTEEGSYDREIELSSSYGGSGGVSLTLGLHHQDVRLSSYFEDPQYSSSTSLVDSQNLYYRNIMEAQLIQDLQGR